MKKILFSTAVFAGLALLFSSTVFASDISILIDGKLLIPPVPPVIENDRVLVPMRSVLTVLGMSVEWDETTKTIIAENDSTHIVLKIDSHVAIVNGVEKVLDVAPKIVNGSTLVPLRFIAEVISCSVSWDGNIREIKVISTNAAKENNSDEANFSKHSPFAVDTLLLGGFDGEKFYNSEEIYKLINDKELYKIYNNDGYLSTEIGTKSLRTGALGNVLSFDDEKFDFSVGGGWSAEGVSLAISNDRDIFARKAVKLNNENSTYSKFVSDFAASYGYPDLKFKILDLYSFDIEGDGIDEVIISANNYSDQTAKNYASVIFMRKYIDGKIENIVLHKYFLDGTDVSSNSDSVYRVLYFCDLNNDGTLEIITFTLDHGWITYDVFELHGNKFDIISTNGYYPD